MDNIEGLLSDCRKRPLDSGIEPHQLDFELLWRARGER